ncbi:FtsB family cell division protein [Arthrobacter sp. TMS1-12-1]
MPVPGRAGVPRPGTGPTRAAAARSPRPDDASVPSASAARAAERSQLAGNIRRGRLGSRRAESVIEPAEEATPIPAKAFSGRLLALAVVLVAVIVLLAPSVSRYLQQQNELDALRADIALQQQQQDDYTSELARWDDPAFVKQQARERIFLVMPGETRYLVKGGGGIEDGTGEGSTAEPADLPWVDSLWSSVARAATD